MAQLRTVDLVDGRDCGSCTVCCESVAVEELDKTTGVMCRHCIEGGGCGIYDTRPTCCREWFCGWRVLGHLNDDWRPDKSGVLIAFVGEASLEHDEVPAAYPRNVMISVMILQPSAVAWRRILEVLGGFVAAGVPAFLSIPGPPGFQPARIFVNEALKEPVARRDGDAAMAVLDRAMQLLSSHPFVPVAFGQRR
jgi:hypothetical protein